MDDNGKSTVLIFDYDGTLNNSALIYVPAFRNMYESMVRDGVAEPREWEDEEITRFLGCSVIEMWLEFMPDINRDLMSAYSQSLAEEMHAMIENGEGSWYPGTEEVLQTLRQRGYRMVVLSNCRKEYMDANREAFQMDRFFEGYYDCESYNFDPKPEIFREIQKDCRGEEYIVIGDRRHDMEVAQVHSLRSIGCEYGYGSEQELEVADETITDIRQLLEILP